MQFYPHNISVGSIASAVSASKTNTGSFIANFSAISINTVNTASVALNITGSMGIDGTSLQILGPTGPIGPRGETGYRGKSIFLLSGSWNVGTCEGPPLICEGPYTLFNSSLGNCQNSQESAEYSTDYDMLPALDELTGANREQADGFILYNSGCTTVAANVSVHNGSIIIYTDGAGVITTANCLT